MFRRGFCLLRLGFYWCCVLSKHVLLSRYLAIVYSTPACLITQRRFMCYQNISLQQQLLVILYFTLYIIYPSFSRCQTTCRDRAQPSDSFSEQHLAQELWLHAGSRFLRHNSGGQGSTSHQGGNTGADPAQGQREEAGGRLAWWHQG